MFRFLSNPAQINRKELRMKGIKLEYGTSMHRGLIYVIRQVNGVYVPLRLEKQTSYREWVGCFSAL